MLNLVSTLIGAVIGVVGTIVGVVVQRHFERHDKAEEDARHKRAVAKALVFEIVAFYHWFYRQLKPLLPPNLNLETCPLPTLSAPTGEFFVVYRGNTDALGTFDETAVELTVKFYGLAERLLSAIQEYRMALANELQLQRDVMGWNSATRKLLGEVQAIMFKTDETAVPAGRRLATVAGMTSDPFQKIDD